MTSKMATRLTQNTTLGATSDRFAACRLPKALNFPLYRSAHPSRNQRLSCVAAASTESQKVRFLAQTLEMKTFLAEERK